MRENRCNIIIEREHRKKTENKLKGAVDMMFNEAERRILLDHIHNCCQYGKDPQAEAKKRLKEVLNQLEMNTRPYRLAWRKPLGLYMLHEAQEAAEILKAEAEL